jgi:arabinose-5-phosphate isomerase
LIERALAQHGKIVVVSIVGPETSVEDFRRAHEPARQSTFKTAWTLHGDLGIVNDGDVILALSYSGSRRNCSMPAPGVLRQDHLLSVAAEIVAAKQRFGAERARVQGSLPFNLAPASTTAMLGVGDALRWQSCMRAGSRRATSPVFILRAHRAHDCCTRRDIMRRANAAVASSATVKESLLACARVIGSRCGNAPSASCGRVRRRFAAA